MSTPLISTAGTAFVQVGPIRLAYQGFGREGDPTVVLIMGLNGQMIAWPDEFCRRLAARGFWVVRFDNRDMGQSTHTSTTVVPALAAFFGKAPAYRLTDLAADTAGLIEALAPSGAHIVGISMGGMIAQTLAVLRPDLVRSLTSMCSTTGNPRVGRPRADLAMRALLMRPARSRQERVTQSVDVLRRISSPGFPFNTDAVATMAAMSYDRGYDPAGGQRQFTAIVAAPDRTTALRQLRMPSLVLHGAADPLINVSGGVATAQAIPSARLRTFAGMGHDIPEALWDTFVDEIAITVAAGEHAAPADPCP